MRVNPGTIQAIPGAPPDRRGGGSAVDMLELETEDSLGQRTAYSRVHCRRVLGY